MKTNIIIQLFLCCLIILFICRCSNISSLSKIEGLDEIIKMDKGKSLIIGTITYEGSFRDGKPFANVYLTNISLNKSYSLLFKEDKTEVDILKIIEPGDYQISVNLCNCSMQQGWSISTEENSNNETKVSSFYSYSAPANDYIKFRVYSGSLIDLGLLSIGVETKQATISPYWPPPITCKLFISHTLGNSLEKFRLQYPQKLDDFNNQVIRLGE